MPSASVRIVGAPRSDRKGPSRRRAAGPPRTNPLGPTAPREIPQTQEPTFPMTSEPMAPESLMSLAIAKAAEGIRAGQTPFGCVIARDGDILAANHNVVWQTVDITAHAEITALRAACQATRLLHLEGCIVATTCEPCPMCMAALHWARVDTVYYGATIDDAAKAGFNELTVPAAELLKAGNSPVKLAGGVLRDECRALFDQWRQQHGQPY